MVAAMVEMEVKAPTPPPCLGLGDHTIGGGGLGNREPGSYIYAHIWTYMHWIEIRKLCVFGHICACGPSHLVSAQAKTLNRSIP